MTSTRCFSRSAAAAAVVLAGVLVWIPASAADDSFVCMEESQEKCDWENKNLDLFIKGRDAFDRGRESGNLGEARSYALQLIERKDAKHGHALMKYIYLQVMQGAHKDLVEAYGWVQKDIQAGETYKRLNLETVRERLAARMTPEQLAEAKK